MNKAPDYERIHQVLFPQAGRPNGDEQLWIQKYLELGDQIFKPNLVLDSNKPGSR